ncbi:DUF4129 domain-containing protein [Microbacterium sp. A94]|uniref:DUF4129 domain-containing protein n=1 Tax=Microbacterium sp. A94 TaxID=3450717 RepID=UPI003F41D7B7
MKRPAIVAAVGGLFLLVIFAAAVQGAPTINPPVFPAPSAPTFTEPAQPMPTGSAAPLPETGSDIVGAIIGTIFLILAALAVIAVLFLVVRALLRAWRDRPLRAQPGSDTGHDLVEEPTAEDTAAAAPVIRRGIEGALKLIDERAIPADAIIASWVGLEESAADAGIARGMSETPAEFAIRIITQREGISDAADALLRLYESVRFGSYVADEQDRDTARTALKTIEEGWQ